MGHDSLKLFLLLSPRLSPQALSHTMSEMRKRTTAESSLTLSGMRVSMGGILDTQIIGSSLKPSLQIFEVHTLQFMTANSKAEDRKHLYACVCSV